MSAKRAERAPAAVDTVLARRIQVGDYVQVRTRAQQKPYIGKVEGTISKNGDPYTIICRVPRIHTHVKWENTLAFIVIPAELTRCAEAVIVDFAPQDPNFWEEQSKNQRKVNQ